MLRTMKTKIIILGSVAILIAISSFFFANQYKTDIMAGSPKLGRPTSMPGPITLTDPLTDPLYKTPDVGQGIVGEEDLTKAIDPAYFIKLYLPYMDENNVPAGSGFAVESSEMLTPGALFTAKVYPSGSNVNNENTIQVGQGTVKSSGILKFDASLPTNLSLGSYTIEVSDGTKVFQTPFVIRPPSS